MFMPKFSRIFFPASKGDNQETKWAKTLGTEHYKMFFESEWHNV